MWRKVGGLAALSAAFLGGSHLANQSFFTQSSLLSSEFPSPPSPKQTFSAEEVGLRNGIDRKEVWVTYKNGVYDVTDFVKEHPGGKRFLMDAAGGPIDSLWAYWAYHTAFSRAPTLLKKYHIGQLVDENGNQPQSEEYDPYLEADPPRPSPFQKQLVEKPWCSESFPSSLLYQFTPNSHFYVRNHAPVPSIDESSHSVSFSFLSEKSIEFRLEELQQRFEIVSVESVVQCAGNRASEMGKISPTSFAGTPFEDIGIGMMGNAIWSGIRIADVLKEILPKEVLSDSSGYHLEMEGEDGYFSSAPLEKILERQEDCLLAFSMNGEPLPPDHGYPVRTILPGIIGARNVKWVYSIRVTKDESESSWQKYYYLGTDEKALMEMPIQSVILEKKNVNEGVVKVRGLAFGGGQGKGVKFVEVSKDGGVTWKKAKVVSGELSNLPENQGRKKFGWVQWECEIEGSETNTFCCRAYDGNGNTQPARPFHAKGYLYNGWHEL